jgi:hypothetical protein
MGHFTEGGAIMRLSTQASWFQTISICRLGCSGSTLNQFGVFPRTFSSMRLTENCINYRIQFMYGVDDGLRLK